VRRSAIRIMHLAEHQRKLLGLFRSTYQVQADDGVYIRKVAESKDLIEGRRNILLWRIYVLERTATLTFRVLKRCKLLEEALDAFVTRCNISPFRETQSVAFLEGLNNHPDSLIASVAQFDLALLKVRQGDPRSYVVSWYVEPYTILNRLARDLPLDDSTPKGCYQSLISRDIPFQFEIFPVREEVGLSCGNFRQANSRHAPK
jgi:hypothetical protein